MFIQQGQIYFSKRETVVVSVVFEFVFVAFLVLLSVLFYYRKGDWQSATQINNGAGKVIPLLNGPKHRHGTEKGTTRAWLVSSSILITIVAANFSGDLIQFFWAPVQQDFVFPVTLDLSTTYNSTIPYDLYNQYSVDGVIQPDALLDSRYNLVLRHAKVSPGSMHGEPITYFTINYDSNAARDSASKVTTCNRSAPGAICYSSASVSRIPCTQTYITVDDLTNTTLRVDSSSCGNSTGMDKDLIPTMDYEFVHKDVDINGLPTSTIAGMDRWNKDSIDYALGATVQHRFRLSSIAYEEGRGLILQSITESHIPVKPSYNISENVYRWPKSDCETTLSNFHFTNYTKSCSNVTIDDFITFVNVNQGPNEISLRYCKLTTIPDNFGLVLDCGTRYLKVSYLGKDVVYKNRTDAQRFYPQKQGGYDLWCGDTEDAQRTCIFDDPAGSYRTFSSRGYGTYTIDNFTINPKTDKVLVDSRAYLPYTKLPELTQRIDNLADAANELFLREYSIGVDKYLLNGELAPGVGYVSLLRYKISIVLFAILAVITGIMASISVILQYFVIPSHYTASAFDVFRVATSPDLDDVKNPDNANQDISVHLDESGRIIITNNGNTIKSTSKYRPVDSDVEVDPSKIALMPLYRQ